MHELGAYRDTMTIRALTQAEVNTLLIQLTLAGYIPGRDFKITPDGQILARKEIFAGLKRIPALPEIGEALPQMPSETEGCDDSLDDNPRSLTSSF